MRSGAALLTASGPAANTKSLNAMTEAEISDKITALLSRYGITPWQQHAIPSRSTAKKIGSCDLYIHDKRAIIEVKRLKRLENGPHSPESGDNGRSAFDQLERYVKAERSQSNARLLDFVGGDPGQASHWVGIVTNFKKWWAWTWPLSASADDGKLQDSFDGAELSAPKERQLIALLQRKTARPVPVELGPMFEPHLKRFLDLYDRVRDYRDTQTQKGLWFKQLEASGNAPDTDADEIFVRHTLLILATRLISKAVGGYEDDAITRGFVCWVSEGGGGEVKSLAADVESYDWNHETRDIMRSLYMGFIPKKHRKSYGEYYTPDWLAEKLAMAVIDEKYIREQLESFQSDGAVRPVLDPACGSGALLYHAGRRILNSKAVGEARQYMDPAKINEFLCAMLYGIDIHPVAVEMAKTNTHRLVRYAPDRHIRVYQGDSLLNRPTANMHSSAIAGPDDLVLYSPKGTTPVLPKLFPKSSESIEMLVRTAKEKIRPPAALVRSLGKGDAGKVMDGHKALTKIVDEEGNGVWEWYIKNQAAPVLLQEQKAGRIMSNPPWVRINQIDTKERKTLIESEARKLGLWVGGSAAPGFDIAALFVDRCSSLYPDDPKKSGWILIGGALKAKAWKGLRDGEIWKDYKAMWDLGSAAFDMGFSTCAVFLGIKTEPEARQKAPHVGETQRVPVRHTGQDAVGKAGQGLSGPPVRILCEQKGRGQKRHHAVPIQLRQDPPSLSGRRERGVQDAFQEGQVGKIRQPGGQRSRGVGARLHLLAGSVPVRATDRHQVHNPDEGGQMGSDEGLAPLPEKSVPRVQGAQGEGQGHPAHAGEKAGPLRQPHKPAGNQKWLAVYNAGGESLYAMKAPPGEYIIEHGCFYVPCGSEAESDCAACSIPRPCCRHSTAQKRAACISGWPSGSACPYPDSTRRTNSMQGLRGCPAKPGSPLQRHTSPNAPAGTSGPTGAPPERYKRRSPKAAFPGRSTICAEP